MKTIRVIQSQKGGEWFKERERIAFLEDTKGQEMQLLAVYPDIAYQEIRGFGGAFTQAAAHNFALMPTEEKERLLDACFTGGGLDYTLGRAPIGSCDFSDGGYTYCDSPGDEALAGFSVACDESELLPFLRAANKRRGRPLSLISAPWSPPAWMKTNGELLLGGRLREEYYGVFARYLTRYIEEYRRLGMDIRWITVQNEPGAVQTWESCLYSPGEEQRFVRDALSPALRAAGLDTGIIVWDHNKERLFSRAREIFKDESALEAVCGLAFHWYSGDHFDNLRLCREQFPQMELFFTEGCVELSGATTLSQKAMKGAGSDNSGAPWEFGECYAHDMIGNFNAGMTAFFDWNLVLDERGGPNHAGNFCSAPILYDRSAKKLILQPAYCFIRHLSAFVPAGARLAARSCYTDRLETCCFVTPEGGVTLVALNVQQEDIPFTLKDTVSGGIAALCAPARSITTFCY